MYIVIGILSHFIVKLIFEWDTLKKEEKEDVCADLEDLLSFSFLVGEENFRRQWSFSSSSICLRHIDL